MTLLIQYLLAHLIGDFFLQTKDSIDQKSRLKWLAPQLYIHVIVHFILLLLIAGFDQWLPSLIITVLHFIIDGCKLQFQNQKNQQPWFFIDQLLHFIVIIGVWAYFSEILPIITFSPASLAAITVVVFLTRPASFFVSEAMSHWNEIISEDSKNEKSLPRAGSYIGILERVLVFGFILIGQWAAIGFLIAAKSIFRIGDLTRARDRKLTEYILIGTFMSFGTAILSGMLYIYFFSSF